MLLKVKESHRQFLELELESQFWEVGSAELILTINFKVTHRYFLFFSTGSFAIWGVLFSCCDCTFTYIRRKVRRLIHCPNSFGRIAYCMFHCVSNRRTRGTLLCPARPLEESWLPVLV